jgi:hypothetical protein
MDRAEGQVLEQMPLQPIAEALRGCFGKAEVFIHVKRLDARPGDIALVNQSREHVDLTGRGREDHPDTILYFEAPSQLARDVVCRCRTHSLAVGVDLNGDCIDRE